MASESYLVIGGEGFLGGRMVEMLLARYPSSAIGSLDIVQRRHSPKNHAGRAHWTFYRADLTDLEALTAAFRQSAATVVIHTASPHIGSPREISEKINVTGTQTVVAACKATGVKCLIYTSSSSVVYDGHHLTNIDERLPLPLKTLDPYSETKARGELIVLDANTPGHFLTCALRPSGIFGPGDRQMIPGFIDVLKAGQTRLQIGNNVNLFDWTYVDNVCHAHFLAAEKLLQEFDDPKSAGVTADVFTHRLGPVESTIPRRDIPTTKKRALAAELDARRLTRRQAAALEQSTDLSDEGIDAPLDARRNRFDQYFGADSVEEAQETYRVAGEAFNITNGEPTYFWDLGRYVWHEYNGHVPSSIISLPQWLAWYLGAGAELFGRLTGRVSKFSRFKVALCLNDKYYNIEKARRVLGYEPIVSLQEGVRLAVADFKQNERINEKAQ
ncbi:uncharacterized protein L969DRAFT_90844 [Mixia osmundae IAM 14324]|uniref:3-beta hydroxysteroid dehydrogenase/isomerase domain-containing protein n=1 Tax=Mixia osmundae (strain CBS 9802 / IAM 14324 / JCM 22182 / KY 12970) TaxID=764103 RepID=G7DWA0_MIXOS|nr:uncharacterized protein L969DRAFT_90844 [Mixia osmundae IAM 14324]KEI36513.1 hypothetical protein L969DRAFT_90844 [Mixia osmundae IAM 14324]GAA94788.1 hypothetical protein E5Q_01442 [Mixia osmundae IAM 14324]